MSRIVIGSDLEFGFRCEACGGLFAEGDFAYSTPDAMTSDGTPIVGSWRCLGCQLDDRPVRR